MKKMMIGLMAAAAMLVVVPETMAAPHGGHRHKGGNDGLRLAAGIVQLVKNVIAPTPVVVAPQPATVIRHHKPVRWTPPRKHKPAPKAKPRARGRRR